MEEATELLNIALKAAQKAGAVQLRFQEAGFDIATKTSHVDLVTSADLKTEKEIVAIIKERFPDHNILAEEGNYAQSSSPFLWIIDPIDGTNNFVKGIPYFSVSIGVRYKNQMVAGVVFNPLQKELYWARKGGGAFLNGRPIQVSRTADFKSAVLITGFYYDRGQGMDFTLKAIAAFFQQGIIGVRRFGSAALDLCQVACARADGFWEVKLNPWDYAAAQLILEEAGGIITDAEGKPLSNGMSFIIASNPHLHPAMQAIIGRLSPPGLD